MPRTICMPALREFDQRYILGCTYVCYMSLRKMLLLFTTFYRELTVPRHLLTCFGFSRALYLLYIDACEPPQLSWNLPGLDMVSYELDLSTPPPTPTLVNKGWQWRRICLVTSEGLGKQEVAGVRNETGLNIQSKSCQRREPDEQTVPDGLTKNTWDATGTSWCSWHPVHDGAIAITSPASLWGSIKDFSSFLSSLLWSSVSRQAISRSLHFLCYQYGLLLVFILGPHQRWSGLTPCCVLRDQFAKTHGTLYDAGDWIQVNHMQARLLSPYSLSLQSSTMYFCHIISSTWPPFSSHLAESLLNDSERNPEPTIHPYLIFFGGKVCIRLFSGLGIWCSVPWYGMGVPNFPYNTVGNRNKSWTLTKIIDCFFWGMHTWQHSGLDLAMLRSLWSARYQSCIS